MKIIDALTRSLPLQLLACIVLLNGCASSGSSKTLSAKSLFDRHIENTFGKDGLQNHTSITSTGRIIIEDFGIEAPMVMRQMSPNNLEFNTEFMGSKITSGCNSENCWSQQPGQSVQLLDGVQKTRTMQQADFHLYENIDKYYDTLVIEPPAEGSESSNHKVVATTASGTEDLYYFSKESGLLIGAVLNLDTGTGIESVRMAYNNYRDFGGMVLASEIMQTMSVATIKMVIDDVSYDALSAEDFSPND